MENKELLFDCLKDIAEDFIQCLEGQGCHTYYSTACKKVININDIKQVIKEAKEIKQ